MFIRESSMFSILSIVHHRVANRVLRSIFLLMAAVGMVSCGYRLQGSKNILYEKDGIRAVYIAPVVNNTFKPGAEITVYNNLLRTINSYGRIRLVKNKNEADAILYGLVQTAIYAGSAGTSVSGLNPKGLGNSLPTKDYVVAGEYTATLSCTFSLNRINPRPGEKWEVWTANFMRSKPFPAANQLDVPGTTSALINESEFDRALADLARSMMDDVHESMISKF